MTKDELETRVRNLENILKETLWMARRYANGRQTFTPGIFREQYQFLKRWMPELLPKHDEVIDDDAKSYMNDKSQPNDWLTDCND